MYIQIINRSRSQSSRQNLLVRLSFRHSALGNSHWEMRLSRLLQFEILEEGKYYLLRSHFVEMDFLFEAIQWH